MKNLLTLFKKALFTGLLITDTHRQKRKREGGGEKGRREGQGER